MPLDPALVPLVPVPPLGVIDDHPAFRARGLEQERAFIAQVAEPGPAAVTRTVETIPVPGGSIALAVFRPDGIPGPLPLHLYLHGGGWIVGSALGASTEVLARERAAGAGCVVVAVDYRMAPEHPFPTPLRDCRAGLAWALDHADRLGIDPRRFSVGGGSAGGNLAAALALLLRDEGAVAPRLQLLEIPTLDLTLGLPSHADPELGSRYALHADDFAGMVAAYLGTEGDAADPYASPLLAPDLAGVAPACVMVAEYDLLRDDGLRFHDRLRAAGVGSLLWRGDGLVHGSQAFTALLPGARAWRAEAIRVLRAAHAGAPLA